MFYSNQDIEHFQKKASRKSSTSRNYWLTNVTKNDKPTSYSKTVQKKAQKTIRQMHRRTNENNEKSAGKNNKLQSSALLRATPIENNLTFSEFDTIATKKCHHTITVHQNFYSPLSDAYIQPIMNLTAATNALAQSDAKTEMTSPPPPNEDGAWVEVVPSNQKNKNDTDDDSKTPTVFPSVFPTSLAAKLSDTMPDMEMIESGFNLTIKLKHNMTVDPKTLVKAMLLSLHIADPWAGLRPITPGTVKHDKVLRTMSDVDEIASYHLYLDQPIRRAISREYTVRMKTNSSIPVWDILCNPLVKEWHKIERIIMEPNNLSTAYLSNVGFFHHTYPNAEALDTIKARVEETMGEKTPRFELAIKNHSS